MLKELLVGQKEGDIAPCPPPKYATDEGYAWLAL